MNQQTTSGSAALLATLLATLVGLLRVCWPGLLFVWPCCWSAQAGEKSIIAITRSGLRGELSKGPFGLLLGPRRLLEQNQELGRAGPNDLARLIHNADAGHLDRYVQSSKIVHAALLLLMLGARTTVTPVSPSA